MNQPLPRSRPKPAAKRWRWRPDFVQARIDFDLRRQRAAREHPEGCECPYCISTAAIERRIRASLARNPGRDQEPPF